MSRFWWMVMVLVSPSVVFGQLDDNTVTIFAYRPPADLKVDQVVLDVELTIGVSSALDDVVAILQSAGVRAEDFSYVRPAGSSEPSAQWIFTLPVPFSKLNGTLASLGRIAQSIAQNKTGADLLYSVQNVRVSPELLASQECQWGPLIEDSRAQAQTLAAAVGLTVGPIVALSDRGLIEVSVPGGALNFPDPATSAVSPSGGAASGAVACSLMVQFQLRR